MAVNFNTLPQELQVMILARIPYNLHDYGNIRLTNRVVYTAFNSPVLPAGILEVQYNPLLEVVKGFVANGYRREDGDWPLLRYFWRKVHSPDGRAVRNSSQATEEVQITAIALLDALAFWQSYVANAGWSLRQSLQRGILALSRVIRLVLPPDALLLLRYMVDTINTSLRRHHGLNLLLTSLTDTQTATETEANVYCFKISFENNLLTILANQFERFADLNYAQPRFAAMENNAKRIRGTLEQPNNETEAVRNTRLLQLTLDQAVKNSLVARQNIVEDLTATVDKMGLAIPSALYFSRGTPTPNSVDDFRARMVAQLRSTERVSDRIRDLFEDRTAAMKIVEGIDVRNIAIDITRIFEAVALMTDEDVEEATKEDVKILNLDTWL